MKKEKDPRINVNNTSIKEYFILFWTLAAFNGFHMWLYQAFSSRGIIETNIQFVIIFFIAYMAVAAAGITGIIVIIRNISWNRPMRKISEAAKKIAQGDYAVRIAPLRKDGKKDYIEVMFDDFNTMVQELYNDMMKIKSFNEKLSELSETDELTKLNNRRSFVQYLEVIWKQCKRLKLPLSVIILDVDFFKKYNDSMGHLEGDNVLKAIAQCMKNMVKREIDFIARFGGEEFICLLPYMGKEKAFDFAEELVKNVENLKILHPKNDNSQYVTISAGLASFVPDDHNSPTQLLDETDKALYSAKESGRNRVVVN